MENVAHNGFMGDFRVIGVDVVKCFSFALANVGGEGFYAMGVRVPVIFRPEVGDEIRQERIRAGRVIRRVGQRQDVLVFADGKSFDLAERRVFQLLTQFLREVRTASLVVRERHPRHSTGPWALLPLSEPNKVSFVCFAIASVPCRLVFQENLLACDPFDLGGVTLNSGEFRHGR